MKRYLLPLLLVLALIGCSRSPVVVEESSQQSTNSTVILPATSEDERDAVSQAFADVVPGSEITVLNRENRKEVRIVTELTSDAVPEDWSDICTALLDAHQQFSETISAQIEASDGTILANSYAGRLLFDHFTNEEPKKPNPPTISLEEFKAISPGMSYQEVYDIIGSGGEEMSSVDFGYGTETQLRMWDGEGSLGANASVTFQNGKVVSKAQAGLG